MAILGASGGTWEDPRLMTRSAHSAQGDRLELDFRDSNSGPATRWRLALGKWLSFLVPQLPHL